MKVEIEIVRELLKSEEMHQHEDAGCKMEVQGVCSEPVSMSNSLFNSVNTGNFDILGAVIAYALAI